MGKTLLSAAVPRNEKYAGPERDSAPFSAPSRHGRRRRVLLGRGGRLSEVARPDGRLGKSYLIRLKQDGTADWEEQETVSLTSDGAAEMIDAMREIARMMKEDGKTAVDAKLKLKELHEYADRIADDFPESAVKAIKSLGVQQVHELIRSALADLAGDELDDQLVLPLDGTYAREHDGGDSYLKNRRDVIGSETVWRVKQRLELIERSARLQAELERDFSLSLADAGCSGRATANSSWKSKRNSTLRSGRTTCCP